MGLWLASAVYGLIFGAILAIAALGFNLQFGVTNYANFSYGPMLTFAAYAAYVLHVAPLHLEFWVSEVLAVVATAIASWIIGNYLFTPFFRRRPQLLFGLAVTFSTAIILDSVFVGIWGSYVKNLNGPTGALTVYSLGTLRLTNLDIAFVVLAVLVFAATALVLNRTRLGKSMRAVSDNGTLATVCGLPTARITAITWALTGALAGIAGLAYQQYVHSFDPTMGDQLFYLLVAAVVFGGIGSPLGAVVGALVIGLVSQLSVLVVGEAYSTVSIFVVLVVLMLARPNGIIRTRGRSVFATA
jgi:branched-subunit amino acid ABC-type transport system permease component